MEGWKIDEGMVQEKLVHFNENGGVDTIIHDTPCRASRSAGGTGSTSRLITSASITLWLK